MLTHRERRILAEMTRRLIADDPQIASRLRWPESRHAWCGPAVVLVAALLSMLVCAVLLLPVATLASGGLAVGALGVAGLRGHRPVSPR